MDGFLWEQWLGHGRRTDDPETLELSETVLSVFLGSHLVEDPLVKDNDVPRRDLHPCGRMNGFFL